MADKVEIRRKIFGKNSFQNVVDTKFKQLLTPLSEDEITPDAEVSTFFKDYDSLFFDIPVSGSSNSHEQLVVRSSEYIGLSIIDLQGEIENLREENISLKNQLFILSQNA